MTAEVNHICNSQDCPTPARYFVTAMDAGKVFYMAGPYDTHMAALSNVDVALKIADKHDGRAWFMSWGTSRITDDSYRPGMVGALNKANLLPA